MPRMVGKTISHRIGEYYWLECRAISAGQRVRATFERTLDSGNARSASSRLQTFNVHQTNARSAGHSGPLPTNGLMPPAEVADRFLNSALHTFALLVRPSVT